MNKQAILKRAKQDPVFRHRVISRLRKKEAAGRTLNQMMIPVFAKYLSTLPYVLSKRLEPYSELKKVNPEIVLGVHEGKEWFIQWDLQAPSTKIELRFNFNGRSKNYYLDCEDNTIEDLTEEFLSLISDLLPSL